LNQIKEVTSGSGWGSQNAFVSHFGIGKFRSIDSIIVYWPSGTISKLNNIPANQIIQISECPAGSSLQEINKDLQTEFVLHQNIPNPFNPTTRISYNLPAADFVLLKVYDILGNEVAVLVSENQNAGSYSVDFNFNNLNSSVLSSGIYFYKLTAGSLTQTKSMMVLK